MKYTPHTGTNRMDICITATDHFPLPRTFWYFSSQPHFSHAHGGFGVPACWPTMPELCSSILVYLDPRMLAYVAGCHPHAGQYQNQCDTMARYLRVPKTRIVPEFPAASRAFADMFVFEPALMPAIQWYPCSLDTVHPFLLQSFCHRIRGSI